MVKLGKKHFKATDYWNNIVPAFFPWARDCGEVDDDSCGFFKEAFTQKGAKCDQPTQSVNLKFSLKKRKRKKCRANS